MMQLTDRMRRAMERAEGVARAMGSARVEPAHLLAALALEEGSGAERLLRRAGIDLRAFRLDLPGGDPARGAGKVPFSPQAKQVVTQAGAEAVALGHAYLGTEHLAVALAGSHTELLAALRQHGAGGQERLRELLRREIDEESRS
ncbi:MAG: hypothetical protein IMX02_03785 [Limnochordaceae bacterium]|nr:hypothetical protein [Limnochordaceae bacterium]